MNQKKVSKFYLIRILLFLIICAGLMYLTNSFFMSLGILLILFVLDEFVRRWDERRAQRRRQTDAREEEE
jgi:Flp pilus assembly protein TadB